LLWLKNKLRGNPHIWICDYPEKAKDKEYAMKEQSRYCPPLEFGKEPHWGKNQNSAFSFREAMAIPKEPPNQNILEEQANEIAATPE